MRRRSRLGLGLAVALTSCAVVAASASAAPPEFVPPVVNPFTATSGKTTLQTVSKEKLLCAADTATGEITGPNTLSIVWKFTGCEHKKVPCNSAGGVAGEIVTANLIGKLGYIVNPEIKEVGLDLFTATGAPLMSFQCGPALRGFVSGSVIGQITPVNKMVKPPGKFTLMFKQKAGKQSIKHLFGEPTDVPMTSFGGPLEESGLGSTDKIGFAAPLEIKA